MSNTLILNSSNVIGNNNSQFQYNFITGNYTIKDDSEISISSITIPYSWYNVSTYYNNQTFQFIWSNGTTYTITLPAGFYTVDDINNYLVNYFIANGMYLIDNNGNYVIYMKLAYDVNYYAVQLLTFYVPTSLPTGYTQPSNWQASYYPATNTAPSLIVLPSNNFGTIIGFSSGTYGGGANNSSTLSNITPVGSTVNSIIVRCSLVNNNVSAPTDILDSFPITATYGSNLNYTPNYEKWIKLKRGTYSSFTISFYDQNLNPIYALDPNVLITLLIKQK